MKPEVLWLLVGLGLIVIELLTGTFYLLILGLAAGVGSVVAWAGAPIWVQLLAFSISAVVASVFVKRKKAATASTTNDDMDVGQTVVFESWVSPAERQARVRYRGTTWDADVLGSAQEIPEGAVLRIAAVQGSRLQVSDLSR
jgi:membrane protein implicated in regulation of membrane protease activity